jgi:predicted branched-subunit amino acid permease
LISDSNAVMRKALNDSLSLPAFILLFTMMGFGSFASSAGFGVDMAALASLLIWGLPGQLVMVELTASGQNIVAIVFACSLANARFLPMVVSFLPKISDRRSGFAQLVFDAQLLSINSWAVCLREFPLIEPGQRRLYFVTFALIILLAGVIGTLIGHQASVLLPRAIILGLIFVSPLFFALVLSSVSSLSHRLSLLLGCAVVPLMHLWFPSVDLLITGLFGGSIGFIVGKLWGKP